MKRLPLVAALLSAPVLLGLAFVVRPSLAAEYVMVTVDGVPGDSTLSGFAGQIDASSISLGFRSPASATEKPTVLIAPVTITKEIDKATPLLMNAGATGKAIKTVTIRALQVGEVSGSGPAVQVYLTATLSDVLVTDWQVVESGRGERGFEQVTLKPTKITLDYVPFDSGGRPGTKISGSVTGSTP